MDGFVPLLTETNQNMLLNTVNVNRKGKLTPNCKKLYKEAMKLKRRAERLEKQNKSTRCQLNLANRFTRSTFTTQLMKKVNSSTFNFIMSQMKIQKKTPQGRRYSLDDKIMALSMFKNSPKGYKFLSTVFALPSKKTLYNLLQQVPFNTGINYHIINNLKHQAEKLNILDRYCTLLFDEMALDATLTYDKKSDSIFGFEENNLKFANHVLVFMLRGLRKKFKQPIAYYFCCGTTKTEDLVSYIKEIICAVQTTGLKIKATVCDQGCTNQAAINILVKETIHLCKTQNIVDKYLGFLINNEEIVPLYDPPHLLKCMRNNLLTKNLKFNYNGKNQTASWSHIETLYRLDKQNEIYDLRTLPKLTEAHIIPSKIRKMRVSVAAQVFSHRVASTMHLIANYGK